MPQRMKAALLYKLNYIFHGIFSPDHSGRRRALVVGFGNYGNYSASYGPNSGTTSNRSVASSPNDALAVATKLHKNAIGDNFEVNCLINQESECLPHPSDIFMVKPEGSSMVSPFERQVNELFKTSHENDVLLFYFSGHGAVDKDGTPRLCIPDNLSLNIPYAYRIENMLKLISESQFKHCILILDCCFSGNMVNLLGSEHFKKIKTGLTILTAGQFGKTVSSIGDGIEIGKVQSDWVVTGRDLDIALPLKIREGFPSAEDLPKKQEDRKHQNIETQYSWFTNYLIEALVGGAANPLGAVSVLSTYQYISEAMGYNQHKLSEKEEKIRPLLFTNENESVTLTIVGTQLDATDMKFLYSKFKKTSFKSWILGVSCALRKEKALRVKALEGHPLQEKSIRKLLQLGLIQRVMESNVEYYILTGRGKHYHDIVAHLYTFQ